MRTIKFKAWSIPDKEMYNDVQKLDWFNGALEGHYKGIIVMQYTGLKDKNGREIYEGDIIKYNNDESMNPWVSGEKAIIFFKPGRFVARISPYDKSDFSNENKLTEEFEDCVEVIGNIYEATREHKKEWGLE